MNINAYSIYDDAAETYSPPYYQRTDALAIRMFQMEATNPDSQIYKYTDDFKLYKVGEFNQETGELIAQQPERIAKASNFKE